VFILVYTKCPASLANGYGVIVELPDERVIITVFQGLHRPRVGGGSRVVIRILEARPRTLLRPAEGVFFFLLFYFIFFLKCDDGGAGGGGLLLLLVSCAQHTCLFSSSPLSSKRLRGGGWGGGDLDEKHNLHRRAQSRGIYLYV
jgi:hypothetical protein